MHPFVHSKPSLFALPLQTAHLCDTQRTTLGEPVVSPPKIQCVSRETLVPF